MILLSDLLYCCLLAVMTSLAVQIYDMQCTDRPIQEQKVSLL